MGLSDAKRATRQRRAARRPSQGRWSAPARARRLFPLGPVKTHAVIFNLGEAGPGELIVQAVVPAAVAGHVDFQGVESFPVLPERLPQGRDRRLAKNFAMMTMAFPI